MPRPDANQESQSKLDFSSYLREPKYTLKDVILPATTQQKVELVLTELQHQELIYQHWGMGKKHRLDKALSINFSGPPGTGKTLTAEAIAHALNRKILDVPYDQIESKYVGETPKHIQAAFQFATEQNALLFFDEADSFLGKRLENVTQAGDSAVNLTRSVMLKQLSAYEGVIVFATNLLRNYDPAFLSRIRRKVFFELPNEEARAAIWMAQIPQELPRHESVNFPDLAKDFPDVSGRDIKNAVLNAVVAAAGEDQPHKQVHQTHFEEAIRQVIQAKSNASEQPVTLTPVEGDVPLPTASTDKVNPACCN
ncbi:MAG: ATP-binding protein [Phormidium sp. BM_Day4_Bin.17]|nr:ATP-binding protein [Phormidium sp. BM_Day4_Bin.17]UCJ10685.1 MAG: ATP-binding protein [Phormidium sp. PBR-2020]